MEPDDTYAVYFENFHARLADLQEKNGMVSQGEVGIWNFPFLCHWMESGTAQEA
jgi:hypothetical protein